METIYVSAMPEMLEMASKLPDRQLLTAKIHQDFATEYSRAAYEWPGNSFLLNQWRAEKATWAKNFPEVIRFIRPPVTGTQPVEAPAPVQQAVEEPYSKPIKEGGPTISLALHQRRIEGQAAKLRRESDHRVAEANRRHMQDIEVMMKRVKLAEEWWGGGFER